MTLNHKKSNRVGNRSGIPPSKSHPWRAGYDYTLWKSAKKKNSQMPKIESIPTKRNVSG